MSENSKHLFYIQRAIEIAEKNVKEGAGGPFGCVIVRNGEIISEGANSVTIKNDPTAHAEVVAIRKACEKLGSFQLEQCDLYTSCEPCPMCLGAIYWARPARVFFAATRKEAASVGFDDDLIYEEISQEFHSRKIPFIHIDLNHPAAGFETLQPFHAWSNSQQKIEY